MSIRDFVLKALHEDTGRGDLFSQVAADRDVQAVIMSKSSGVLAGEIYARELMEWAGLKWLPEKRDGGKIRSKERIAEISGSYLKILECERTLLNLLQHASGIATLTNRYVTLLGNNSARLLDTRKTRPLLRNFEKYATRIGGAWNHRMGLDDCLMLKDTHLAHIDDLKSFMEEAKKKIPFTTKIEVECETLPAAMEAMEAGADIVMCDNMCVKEISEIVAYRNEYYSHILLEASGNVTLENLSHIASSGIDAVSTGSIIHQAVWLDFSMKMVCDI